MAARNILLLNSEKCCNVLLLHLLFNHGIVLTIIFLTKGHWYSTRIMSRLSTALSNRLIWLYLRIQIFMSTPLPSTQRTQKRINSEVIIEWLLANRISMTFVELTKC